MAPSGQTVTTEATTARVIPIKGVSDYKEAYIGGPKVYDAEKETKGSAEQPAAKYPNYLPTWDANKK